MIPERRARSGSSLVDDSPPAAATPGRRRVHACLLVAVTVAWATWSAWSVAQLPALPVSPSPPASEADADVVDPVPAPAAPVPDSRAVPSDPELTVVDGIITASVDGEPSWTWPVTASTSSATVLDAGEEGATPDVVLGPVVGPFVLAGDGPYLIALRLDDGTVVGRWATPGRITAIHEHQDGTRETDPPGPSEPRSVELRVTAGPDTTAVVPIGVGVPSLASAPQVDGLDRLSFGTDPRTFTFLRDRATTLATADDIALAELRDPTDPWPAVAAATGSASATRPAPTDRDAAWVRAEAASLGRPFFETAALALAALDAGEVDRYDRWMARAALDMLQRGYDPRWILDVDLRTAYGLPHAAFATSLDQGDLTTARALAPWSWRTASFDAPETIAALRTYVSLLRDARAFDEARLWQDRVRELDAAGPSAWLDRGALVAGRWGYAGAAALVIAFVASWMVLLAKVWRVETLLRRQRRERGRTTRAWTRLWALRHVGTTEKIALLGLAAAIVVQTTLAAWSPHDRTLPVALVSGTWSSPEAVAAIAALPEGPERDVLEGVAAATSGDPTAAEAAFRRANGSADAWTNLGTVTGDVTAFERALDLDPREPIARFALGRADDPSPFHAAVDPTAALWAAPSRLELIQAAFGSWRGALSTIVTDPASAIWATRPDGLAPAVWTAVVVSVLLPWAGVVISLVIPRARVARNAPRNLAYHLGALLVPGSGHLDELWGVLLLVPWALVATDLWTSFTSGTTAFSSPSVAWGVMIGIYTASTIGFVVETISYRHRMRTLRESQPELAISYGLRPLASPTHSDAS